MIRFSVVKLADRLGTRGQIAGIEAIEGKVDWMETENWGDTEAGNFINKQNRRRSSSANLDDLKDTDEDQSSTGS